MQPLWIKHRLFFPFCLVNGITGLYCIFNTHSGFQHLFFGGKNKKIWRKKIFFPFHRKLGWARSTPTLGAKSCGVLELPFSDHLHKDHPQQEEQPLSLPMLEAPKQFPTAAAALKTRAWVGRACGSPGGSNSGGSSSCSSSARDYLRVPGMGKPAMQPSLHSTLKNAHPTHALGTPPPRLYFWNRCTPSPMLLHHVCTPYPALPCPPLPQSLPRVPTLLVMHLQFSIRNPFPL